jgi:hypothetical protein
MFNINILKEAFGIIPALVKDNKGKWSSKRTISGVLVYLLADYMQTHEMDWKVLVFAFISVLPLCMSVFENKINKQTK